MLRGAATTLQLHALDAAFEAARDGGGAVVVVDRDVLGRAAGRAKAAGLDVLSATAEGSGDRAPFALARALLEPRLAAMAPAQRDAAFAGAGSLARPLFEPVPPPAGDVFEVSAVHGLYWLVSNLAAEAPLAVLVGDPGHADRPSLRLLHAVCQRIDEQPIVLVADAPVSAAPRPL